MHLPVSLRAFQADAPGELGVSRQVAPHALSVQRPEPWDAAARLLRAAWQQSASQPSPMQQPCYCALWECSRPAALVSPYLMKDTIRDLLLCPSCMYRYGVIR